MEQITRKDFHAFCENFAHEFIASECMMKEFRKLSCGDAQQVKEHLENHLMLDLRDWLEEKGVEIERLTLMETKLNDNDVKEIVEMQQKIDSYEGFIRAAFFMAKSGRHVNYPIFSHTDFADEMNFIWKTIKEKCVNIDRH